MDAVLHTLECHDRVLLHAPTGAGKTRMAMSVVSMHLRQNAPTMVLWLAPTRTVEQAAKAFGTAWEAQRTQMLLVIVALRRGAVSYGYNHATRTNAAPDGRAVS